MKTYGATRHQLADNGYVPSPANGGDGPAAFLSEQPAAIVLPLHGSNLVAIKLDVRNAKLRDELRSNVVKALGSCPVRIGSDGVETYLTRGSLNYGHSSSSTYVPAGESHPLVSVVNRGTLPLDATWKNGDPTTVRYDRLPLVSDETLDALTRAVDDVLRRDAPEWVPPKLAATREPSPSEKSRTVFVPATDSRIDPPPPPPKEVWVNGHWRPANLADQFKALLGIRQ